MLWMLFHVLHLVTWCVTLVSSAGSESLSDTPVTMVHGYYLQIRFHLCYIPHVVVGGSIYITPVHLVCHFGTLSRVCELEWHTGAVGAGQQGLLSNLPDILSTTLC